MGLESNQVPEEESEPYQAPEDEEEESEGETEDEGHSDRDWAAGAYHHAYPSDGTGTVDVPTDISEMAIAVQFKYWPPAEPASGICSTESELTIEVVDPAGETRITATFDETMETGPAGTSCGEIEAILVEDPAPGEWVVSFTGEGIATGQVSFRNE